MECRNPVPYRCKVDLWKQLFQEPISPAFPTSAFRYALTLAPRFESADRYRLPYVEGGALFKEGALLIEKPRRNKSPGKRER